MCSAQIGNPAEVDCSTRRSGVFGAKKKYSSSYLGQAVCTGLGAFVELSRITASSDSFPFEAQMLLFSCILYRPCLGFFFCLKIVLYRVKIKSGSGALNSTLGMETFDLWLDFYGSS